MQLLASCSIEQGSKFNGGLVLPNENKKTPDKVFLNIVVENGDTSVLKQLKGNEKCVTFKGVGIDFCPTSLEGKLFNEISLEDLKEKNFKEVKGITTLVRLPDDYCDMRTLRDYCNLYSSIRFIGGNLLKIDGVRIGRYDEGKDKMLPVFNEIYDSFVEVDLNDLDGLQEKVKRTRKRAEGTSVRIKKGKKAGSKQEKKTPKRVESFNRLFDDISEEF